MAEPIWLVVGFGIFLWVKDVSKVEKMWRNCKDGWQKNQFCFQCKIFLPVENVIWSL